MAAEWCIMGTEACGGATAWVQAVGSIIAIFVAIAVALAQERREQRRLATEERRRLEDAAAGRDHVAEQAALFAEQLEFVVHGFVFECQTQRFILFESLRA